MFSSFQSREFSCQVPDVVFKISSDRAQVTVTVTKAGDEKEVYSEYLYPDSESRIRLSDVDCLLEPYVNRWLLFSLDVRIVEERVTTDSGNESVTTVDERTLSSEILSCNANILNTTASSWCDFHFLTLIDGARTTAMGWQERLCYIGSDTASCTAWYDDGSSQSMSVPVITGVGDCKIIDCSPVNFLKLGLRLMRYTITAGSRKQDYEVDHDVEPEVAPVLLFWNSFGVQELAYCTGELKQVSSFDRKQARIGRLKETYQMEEKESFKADTGILTFPMANWWREVLRSRDVRVMHVYNGSFIVDYGTPVVITSEKMELSNTPEHLPRITFEYEYADRNHNIFDVRAEGRIFDDTFDYTFN